MPPNRNTKNPANSQSDLFRALTRLFSGPYPVLLLINRLRSSQIYGKYHSRNDVPRCGREIFTTSWANSEEHFLIYGIRP